ncbi:MAG TPA: MarR family winged helix-turn-helix transcriptional regulator [Candidatus Binatia bacterium]|jgi:DNA-binding MarR family transcriptional regulator|nr:MarR family winged helix-turn-helix transcriptional regulator [Candidatus Binatia bacterium]
MRAMPGKEKSAEPRSLALKVRRTAFVMDRIIGRALARDGGLSLPHCMMLYFAARFPGVTQRTIASHLDLTEAAVSRQAELLRRRGLIIRGRNPESRRERTVTLTPEGRRALAAARRRVRGIMDRFFSVLRPAERKVMAAAFDRLFAAMAAECRPGACPAMAEEAL